jgi:hypothetical protein
MNQYALISGIISTNLINVPALLVTAGNVTNICKGDAGMSILSKKCTKCGEVKSADQFAKSLRYKSGLYPSCKDCNNADDRKRYQENREVIKAKKLGAYYDNLEHNRKRSLGYYYDHREQSSLRNRSYYLKTKFGITLEQYQEMFDAQGGVCAVCGKPETSKSNTGDDKLLAVDHDHKTGKVRGLLCHKCNAGIGHFDDNESLLDKAIRYLRKFGL